MMRSRIYIDWRRDPLGILRLWRKIRRWLALKEMGGFNPFYSPSLAWREASEEAMIAMKNAILGPIPREYELAIERLSRATRSPEAIRRNSIMVGLMDRRRGGY